MNCRFLIIALCVCLCTAAIEPSQAKMIDKSVDLLADESSWSEWAHRPEISPQFRTKSVQGLEKTTILIIETKMDDAACGCWRRKLPTLKKGHRYILEAAFEADGVDSISHCVWAILSRDGREFMELAHEGVYGNLHRMGLRIEPDEDWSGLQLRLYLAWSPNSVIRWSNVHLTDVTDLPYTPRIVRLAAVSGAPQSPKTPQECLDFYCQRLDEVGAEKVDLVCLPEVINTSGLKGDTSRYAEPIPGPSTSRLMSYAKKYSMYVAASLSEREGKYLYNTGVLIDREGRIAGKYRKTHLTIGESLLSGKTPGNKYPVFKTDFGRVGYIICYDNHFPEVARALAVQGADVIVFSNMADGREKGILWEPYMQTRALDNQVHIVAAVNGGRSCIVSPRGEILSIVDKTRGAIAIANCDIDTTVRNYSRRQIGKRYMQVRRSDTFEILTHEYLQKPTQPLAEQQVH